MTPQPPVAPEGLFVSGTLHEGCETIYLLSPDEPGFWAHVTAEAEFSDGAPDPLDRWSARVIGTRAAALGGRALFPFGGPPFLPFFGWMKRSGMFHDSPVRLLAHPRMGLWASVRGAIVLPGLRPLLPPTASPCTECPAPCRSACPTAALTARGYDLDACHGWLDREAGKECLTTGCCVRRSCPTGAGYGRLASQSAWHMRHFHK